MAHQKVTPDFPTAELPQIGAGEGNRTLIVSLEEFWKSVVDQSKLRLSGVGKRQRKNLPHPRKIILFCRYPRSWLALRIKRNKGCNIETSGLRRFASKFP